MKYKIESEAEANGEKRYFDIYIYPAELKNLRMSVLVIVGTHDMIKRSHTELIAASIPGAKLRFIKGDHFIANKNPDDFNRAVDEFLEKNV